MAKTTGTQIPLSKTDVLTVVRYLEDAAKLYEALAALPMQKATSRVHMINQLTNKLKSKVYGNDQTRHH